MLFVIQNVPLKSVHKIRRKLHETRLRKPMYVGHKRIVVFVKNLFGAFALGSSKNEPMSFDMSTHM
jgi:hypothetical protein